MVPIPWIWSMLLSRSLPERTAPLGLVRVRRSVSSTSVRVSGSRLTSTVPTRTSTSPGTPDLKVSVPLSEPLTAV